MTEAWPPDLSILNQAFWLSGFLAGHWAVTRTPKSAVYIPLILAGNPDSPLGEWIYLTVCPFQGPDHDSSVGE